jgi:hypothetical protein
MSNRKPLTDEATRGFLLTASSVVCGYMMTPLQGLSMWITFIGSELVQLALPNRTYAIIVMDTLSPIDKHETAPERVLFCMQKPFTE